MSAKCAFVDSFGRVHNYLRVSIEESCNLKCKYCDPEGHLSNKKSLNNMSDQEIYGVSKFFVRNGVKTIRLTGGEPTIRSNFTDLCQKLASLRQYGLEKLNITTNGVILHRHAQQLVDKVDGINISLDTLKPEKYKFITGFNAYSKVQKSIDEVLKIGKFTIKLNIVVMKEWNMDEIIDFVEYSRKNNIEIRFIEFMPFTGNKLFRNCNYVPNLQVKRIIEIHYGPLIEQDVPISSTSKVFKLQDNKGKISFISSVSDPFCYGCNRLRISSTGNLQLCLFGKDTDLCLPELLRKNVEEGCEDEKVYNTQIVSAVNKVLRKKHAKYNGLENIVDHQGQKSMLLNGG